MSHGKKHENLKIYGKQKYTCLNYKEEVLCFYFLLLKQKKKLQRKDEKEWLPKNKSKPIHLKMANTLSCFPQYSTVHCTQHR